jgi:hypothetical protein
MRILRALNPVLHPVLFAAYPLLALFALNQDEVRINMLWIPLALCTLAAVLLYAVLTRIFGSGPKAGALASLACLTFFYYGLFLEKAEGWGMGKGWFLALWLAIFVVGAVLLVRTNRPLDKLTLILLAGAAILVVRPIAEITVYQVNHPMVSSSDPRLWPTVLPSPTAAKGPPPPDIYVLMPDDYARLDVLKQKFGYDDSAFAQELRKRGFVFSRENRSPYSISEENMAAALNMDYVTGLAETLGSDSQDLRPLPLLIHENRAARLLEPLGYRYTHLDTDDTTYSLSNPDISPVASPDSFMNVWMQESIMSVVGGPLGFNQTSSEDRFRSAIDSVFQELTDISQEPGPKFVVFHTLIPHDPYVFGADGQPVTFEDTTGEQHSSKRGMSAYVDQIIGLNQRLLDAVDAIQANSETPPVIVLMADEGYEGRASLMGGEKGLEDARVKGVLAISMPGSGKPAVPKPPNIVNVMRFVFNRTLGTNYEMLPTASYPEGDYPYKFTDELEVK